MATLVFEDGDWTIATAAWSAGAKGSGRTVLSYAWGATIGWTANSTGVAQIELDIGIDAFVKLVASGGPLVDLRRTVRATKG